MKENNWFIFRNRLHYEKVYAESLEMAKLLFYTRHYKCYFYFKYIGFVKTKKAYKNFIKWNRKAITTVWGKGN